MPQGIFIAIEGSDGSGKETQSKLLFERLKSEGYDVATYDFPQYNQESSYFVREYLNGNYGTAESIGPYTPSLFYALDRFSAATQIAQDLAEGKVVISNRYVGSNMAHQGTKFSTVEERTMFWQWLDQLEFGMLQIPRPDQNIVLLVPAETAQQLVDQKEKRTYTEKKRYIHEADLRHLQKAAEVYQQLCQHFKENFEAIDCTRDGRLMSIPNINNLIWERIEPMLSRLRKKQDPSEAANTHVFAPKQESNPYITKSSNGTYVITETGKQYLSGIVTNTDQDVYMFTNKMKSRDVAIAISQLSRRGDDVRTTLLSGPSDTESNNDDIQQLTGTHFVIENASDLLARKLEQSQPATYIERPNQYASFDQKDVHDKFKYYTPGTLSKEHAAHYNQQMDALFENYSTLVEKLADHIKVTSSEPEEVRNETWRFAAKTQASTIAQTVLPVAVKSTVGVFASAQALESLIIHLQSDKLHEAQTTGNALYSEAKKVIPNLLGGVNRPSQSDTLIAYQKQTQDNLAELVQKKNLQPIMGDDTKSVELTDYWPKNEFSVLPHMIYEQSSLSLSELEATIDQWRYADKEAAVKAYMGERIDRHYQPGHALKTIYYTFDLIYDYGTLRDLQGQQIVDNFKWQQLTPHYGYKTPKIITEAGLDELFEDCFDLSVKLYQYLLENGYQHEAQYCILLGHKTRLKATLDASEMYHLIETANDSEADLNYRKLIKQMHAAISSVHPIISSGIIVNKSKNK